MSKATRPHAPGQYFHLTARTQNKTKWFDEELRDRITAIIREAGPATRTHVVAFTVMTNHLHIVVQQGQAPLGWLMHRVLHRTAMLVKLKYNADGHVFGRRYWSGLCDDAFYSRQAIIYTHLNPVYAGLCSDPSEYRWCSHQDYLCCESRESCGVTTDRGLPLFAQFESSPQHLVESYRAFIEYWKTRERLPLGVKFIYTDEIRATVPSTHAGDLYWTTSQATLPVRSCATPRRPVYDAAVDILKKLAPHLRLDDLRCFGSMSALWQTRRELIAALDSRGYRGAAIARCLNVSPALVSLVRRAGESPPSLIAQRVTVER